MKPLKSVYCLLGLLSLSASLAIAQEGERKGPPPGGEGGSGNRLGEFLKRADTSGDGKISKEEFGALSRGGGDERFAKMDANSDGYVDQTEIATIAEKMREGMRNRPAGEGGEGGFRRPGGDGGEGGSRRPPGDRPEGGPKPEGDRPAGGPEGGRRPEGGPGGPGGAIMIDEVFGRMDKNSDGTVDKAEYVEFSQQEIESRFSRVDQNTDGKLTKEEMKEGMERMRNMMRGPGGPGGQRGPGGEGGRGPGGEGGPRRGPEGGDGGFRRPPSQEGEKATPRPEFEPPAPKKDPA